MDLKQVVLACPSVPEAPCSESAVYEYIAVIHMHAKAAWIGPVFTCDSLRSEASQPAQRIPQIINTQLRVPVRLSLQHRYRRNRRHFLGSPRKLFVVERHEYFRIG